MEHIFSPFIGDPKLFLMRMFRGKQFLDQLKERKCHEKKTYGVQVKKVMLDIVLLLSCLKYQYHQLTFE